MPGTLYLRFLCRPATRADKRGCFAPFDEAPELTHELSSIPLHAQEQLVCAPEPRVHDVAQALWSGHAITRLPALAECNMGTWSGHFLRELPAEALAAWLADPDAAPHGGESLHDLKARVGNFMEGLIHARDNAGRGAYRLMAVTHASVIRAAIGHALDCPHHVTASMDIAPCAMVTLTFHRQWRWRLEAGW